MLLGPFLNTLTQNILPHDLFVKNENNCQIKQSVHLNYVSME